MNNLSLLVMLLAMGGVDPDTRPSSSSKAAVQKSAAVHLCAALEAIQPGDRLPVALDGFYREENEEKIFLQGRSSCPRDVEPVVEIEFVPGAKLPPDLRAFLDKPRKSAWISVTGILVGRPRESPRLSGAALGAGEENTSVNRRHRLIAEDIAEAWLPAEEMENQPPSPWQGDRSPYPVVQSFAVVSRYPQAASRLGVDGDVVVEVMLKRGNDISLRILSTASPLLVDDTLAQIRTWEFDPASEAVFTTTFSYRFENLPSTTPSVQVRTELPIRVEVVAARPGE